jgi:hypothetical protein
MYEKVKITVYGVLLVLVDYKGIVEIIIAQDVDKE